MLITKVSLHQRRLPNGKFLGLVETVPTHGHGIARQDALMLVSEEILNKEIMTNKYEGPRVLAFRTGVPIHENEALCIGEHLGSLGDMNYFLSTAIPG